MFQTKVNFLRLRLWPSWDWWFNVTADKRNKQFGASVGSDLELSGHWQTEPCTSSLLNKDPLDGYSQITWIRISHQEWRSAPLFWFKWAAILTDSVYWTWERTGGSLYWILPWWVTSEQDVYIWLCNVRTDWTTGKTTETKRLKYARKMMSLLLNLISH